MMRPAGETSLRKSKGESSTIFFFLRPSIMKNREICRRYGNFEKEEERREEDIFSGENLGGDQKSLFPPFLNHPPPTDKVPWSWEMPPKAIVLSMGITLLIYLYRFCNRRKIQDLKVFFTKKGGVNRSIVLQ